MKNNPLDDIVKCDIDLSDPVSNEQSFGSLCLIVPPPADASAKGLKKATLIYKASELLDYGFTVEDVAYRAAQVACSQNPAPTELYMCVRGTVEPEKPSDGSDPGEPTDEAITNTLIRAQSECGAYGYHLSEYKKASDLVEAIKWAESETVVLGFEYTDIENFPVQNTSYYRTFGIFSGKADGYEADKQPEENEFACLAWMAKCFGYQPGSETWAFKTLATIVPSVLSADNKKELEKNNISSFLRYSGKNVTIGGKVLSGEWIDVIRFRDWLKSEIQTNVFNAIQANTKTPYTDGGIGMIEGALEETLSKGQDVGGIAETEYDEEDNEIPGYTVIVPLAASLTEAERKSRKLPGVKWSARLAGAIHVVEIGGNLTF